MKDYINFFHSIVSEVHFWDDLSKDQKKNKISLFIDNSTEIDYLVEYFEEYQENLQKKNLNYFLKSVEK